MQAPILGLEIEYAVGTHARSGSHVVALSLLERLAAANPHLRGHDAGIYLANGSRWYADNGHLEYASPECTNPRQLMVYERAAERQLQDVLTAARSTGRQVWALKNNIDYWTGATYGCHENYSCGRPPAELADSVLSFLVTRTAYCGAGKLASRPRNHNGYDVSQRASFCSALVGGDTTSNRAIFSLKDEPLSAHGARCHLILGDSLYLGGYLRTGATALVLRMAERGALQDMPHLQNPVAALQRCSEDLCCDTTFEGTSARDIQEAYLAAASRYLSDPECPEWAEEVIAVWTKVLAMLDRPVERACGHLDAYTKHAILCRAAETSFGSLRKAADWAHLLNLLPDGLKARAGTSGQTVRDALQRRGGGGIAEAWAEENRLDWNELGDRVAALDRLREACVRYHDVDPERGIWHQLNRAGLVQDQVAVDEEAVARAMREPPPDQPRARSRGRVIRERHGQGCTVSWTEAVAADGLLDLADPASEGQWLPWDQVDATAYPGALCRSAMSTLLVHEPGRRALVLHEHGVAMNRRGWESGRSEDFAEAIQYLEQALALRERSGDTCGMAWTRREIAQSLIHREAPDYARASLLLDQSLAAAGEDLALQAHIWCSRATLAFKQDDLATAEQQYTTSLHMAEQVGTRYRQAYCCFFLGQVVDRRGARGEAEGYFARARELSAGIPELRARLGLPAEDLPDGELPF